MGSDNSIKTLNNKAVFIFRRDIRLEDNKGLIAALKESKEVIPIFIFDPRQADKSNNQYFSENAFCFLIQSLKELDLDLKKRKSHLYIFSGIAEEIISELIKKEKIDAVYVNTDYTPFSKKRDDSISIVCKKNNIKFESFADVLLNEPEATLKQDNKPYTIFTPYWKNASKIPVISPSKNNLINYYKNKIVNEKTLPQYTNNSKRINGGRTNALKILSSISKFQNYTNIRDHPSIEGTTKLSAHLKFGTISIREAYQIIATTLGESHPILRQFYWRDFFYHIAYHFPKIFGHSFNDKYEKVQWDNSEKLFDAWKNGVTGFPIIDAGMRELNTTGYMHNRVRMIVASFLTKDLHIDRRLGEKYFAQKLVDYDPCLNNGNWQWAASTGCDAQPYFRIFNPWRQQERFDPECKYIKYWVLELKDLTPEQIHNIGDISVKSYPKPIVEHSLESKKAIARYKTIS